MTRVSDMPPEDAPIVPADVVAEVLRDPERFFAAAAEAAPGWSIQYGGAEGVAQLTSAVHAQLLDLVERNAALRGASVLYLYRHANVPMAKIARLLGVTRGAVNHVVRRAEDPDRDRVFVKLESPRGWKP